MEMPEPIAVVCQTQVQLTLINQPSFIMVRQQEIIMTQMGCRPLETQNHYHPVWYFINWYLLWHMKTSHTINLVCWSTRTTHYQWNLYCVDLWSFSSIQGLCTQNKGYSSRDHALPFLVTEVSTMLHKPISNKCYVNIITTLMLD